MQDSMGRDNSESENAKKVTIYTYDTSTIDWISDHTDMYYWQAEADRYRQLLPSGNVLDVGCGFGRDCHFFTEPVYKYVGLDFSIGLLAEAVKRFPGVKFVWADMLKVPMIFRANQFDGFWAVASLLHIEKYRIRDVLKGIREVVRKGGIGFISVKKGEGERVVEEDHGGQWSGKDRRFYAFYHREEFENILEDCGFRVLEFGERSRGENTVWLEFFVERL
jgi:ubiquinone/menaquinone biosynthesis C-methylase UbiE